MIVPGTSGAPRPSAAPAPRLRIVHVITSLEEGGAQAMLLKLLGAQASTVDARVVSLVDGGGVRARLEALPVPVTSLGMRRGRPGLRPVLRLARALRDEPPDLVQTWLYHADLLGGVAAALAGVPVVWGVRNDRLLPASPGLTRLAQRACALLSTLPRAIVCNSEAARRAHARLGYARERLVVVPNGFDLRRFRASPAARRAIRRELGVPEEAPLVGQVARLHPDKDHATFLAAAARVAVRRPEARFVLCGEGVGWQAEGLAAAIEASGLRGRVHLLGRRPDVERVTAALDVACLLSRTESFPNVVGEAMACEVPCVATDCGDVREILGDCGRVVPPGDPAAAAGAILELLSLAADERRAMGAAARARVLERFDLAAVAGRFLEVQRAAAR